ncbi:uncharacterized protein LOC116198420 [Punica granatum]|uniref:Uncharacterized protein LOC116198420 n=2 Tax=Punica granatum TaxID=22663 RepID=A0A6P8CLW7_PUNGR|nr:uncharacterized protein LOC116198420 [Punica granatum]
MYTCVRFSFISPIIRNTAITLVADIYSDLSTMGKQRKLLAMDDDGIGVDDGFSSLPEPLIQHILSFLPFREAVKAALVCKSWGQACSSFPILDFQTTEFVGKNSQNTGKKLEIMMELVEETMMRFQDQQLKIDMFKFHDECLAEGPRGWFHHIDKWIGIALDNNVEERSIIDGSLGDQSYLLSERILSAPSIISLKLKGGGLALSASSDASINLKHLRSLTLELFSIDDRMFKRLVSACHSLEFLSIAHCRALKEIRVSGPHNIKRVHLETSYPTTLVEIEAPSLESFHYRYISFGHAESLVLTLNHSPNLKSLKVANVSNSDEWFEEFLSRFPVLEDLTIESCFLLRRIRILSPLIRSVVIKHCHNLIDINLETPELTLFELHARDGMLPSIRKKTTPSNDCAAHLIILSSQQVEPGWSCKLMSEFLPTACKLFRPMTLNVWTPGFAFELSSHIRYRWLAKLACNLKQLLGVWLRSLSEKMLPLAIDPAKVNGLLLTPHPTSATIIAGLSEDDFLQFFCKKVAETQGRSTSGSCDCWPWPHQLEDLKIETVTGSDYRGPIRRDRHTI